MFKFIKAYVKSMRLYYAFVTGVSGWIGLAFYDFLVGGTVPIGRQIVILTILFFSWGVNQIINDYLGLAEDRVNAPHRPMVSGELNIIAALSLTGVFLLIIGTLSYLLNPWALLVAGIGILLNIIYEYAKAWGLLGNLIFGLMIASCTLFGFIAAGPLLDPVFTTNRYAVLVLVTTLNAVMTYYTYFKDYEGDKKAKKNTFIVQYGLNAGRYVGLIGSLLSALVLWLLVSSRLIPFEDILFPHQFFFCCIITLFLQVWTAVRYFRNPHGVKTYFSLVTNFRAAVAGQVTIIAIFDGNLALYLLVVSYIFIGFLFGFHGDSEG